jgi:ketosteroid isomerase-like protein
VGEYFDGLLTMSSSGSGTVSELERNKAVCKAFYHDLGRRDFAAALAHLADDVVWWVQGEWEGAGFYRGKAAVEGLLAPLKYAIATDIEFKFGHLTAEEDRVSCELTGSATTSDGGEYRMTYHFLFTIRDGKIREGHEYLDTKKLCDVLFSKNSLATLAAKHD